MESAIMSSFDEKAVDWDDDPKKVQMSHDFVAALAGAAKLNKGMRALEFGCGTGIAAMEVAQQVGSVVAVDTSAGMLGVLRKKIEAAGVDNIDPMQVDLLEDKPFEGGFDLIYSSMVFHHLPNVEQVLTYFYEILNPGGLIAIADLDAEDGSFHSEGTEVEHHGFKRDEFMALLRRAGFVEVEGRTAFVIERDRQEGIRHYRVFLVTGRTV